MGAWWVDKVLPGLIVGIPYTIIGAAGLWWNLRRGQQHLNQVTEEQNKRLEKVIKNHEHR